MAHGGAALAAYVILGTLVWTVDARVGNKYGLSTSPTPPKIKPLLQQTGNVRISEDPGTTASTPLPSPPKSWLRDSPKNVNQVCKLDQYESPDEDEGYTQKIDSITNKGDYASPYTDEERWEECDTNETTGWTRSVPRSLPVNANPTSSVIPFPQLPRMGSDEFYVNQTAPTIPNQHLTSMAPTQRIDDESSDDNQSDYETIDSDLSDYEHIDQPTLIPPKQAIFKTDTLSRTAVIIKKKLRKLKLKRIKHEPDFADDELTEDPYREHHFGNKSMKPKKPMGSKRHRQRNDPLPMPLESEPSAQHRPAPLRTHPEILCMRSPVPSPNQASTCGNIDVDSDLSDYEPVSDIHNPYGSEPSAQHRPAPLRTHPEILCMRSPVPSPNQASTCGNIDVDSDLSDYEPVSDIRNPYRSSSLGSQPSLSPDYLSPKLPVPTKLSNLETKDPQRPVGMVSPSTPVVNEEFPRDLCKLSVEGVALTLRKLNMPDVVVDSFRKEQIDGEIFVCLDDQILDDLNVRTLDKLKILKFKNGWRPKCY